MAKNVLKNQRIKCLQTCKENHTDTKSLLLPFHFYFPFLVDYIHNFTLLAKTIFQLRYAVNNITSSEEKTQNMLFLFFFNLFFLTFYLFLRERKREGGAERQSDGRSQQSWLATLPTVSTEPDTGFEPMNHEIMT